MQWLYLGLAIVCEVIATSALKSSDGFSRPLPSALVVVGYAVAFYSLSLALRTLPVGIAYAIWAGVGIALIAVIGLLFYGQTLDLAAVAGIGLIVAGVLVLSLLSKSTVQA